MGNLLSLGTVATAIGLVLTVAAWKMNARSANVMLLIAWGLFATSIYTSIPWIEKQAQIPRVLWTALFSSVIGLLLYQLWTLPEPPKIEAQKTSQPVKLSTVVIDRDYPKGHPLAGEWLPIWSDLRVVFTNQSPENVEDFDVQIVVPTAFVTKFVQVTNIPECHLLPPVPPEPFVNLVAPDGSKVPTTVRDAVPMNAPYRVRCDRLPRRSRLELLLAVENPKSPGADQLAQIRGLVKSISEAELEAAILKMDGQKLKEIIVILIGRYTHNGETQKLGSKLIVNAVAPPSIDIPRK